MMQIAVLILSFVLIFLWRSLNLSNLTVPAVGILVAAYLLLSFRKKGKGFLTMGGEGPWGIFILNTLIFLLIFSTGGFNSLLYFLLYFLAFGIAFVFAPVMVFAFVLGTIVIFLPDALSSDLVASGLKLGSLLLLSPLAYFFGAQYNKNDREEEKVEALEERTKEAADTIAKDVEEVVKEEKGNLKSQDVDKLNEVLEETEDLREESKNE